MIQTTPTPTPLDDQTQARIRVETEAVLAILAAVESNDIELLGSEALEYEINRIPDQQRRLDVLAILTLANERIIITEQVEKLVGVLESQGARPMDAIHLALASVAKADYFVTCDDQLLRKGQLINELSCKVISVLDFLVEVTK
ncbi:MAG: hypothetical protein ACWA44_05020 [Thiotrichales bacterium]